MVAFDFLAHKFWEVAGAILSFYDRRLSGGDTS